jgi:hypothetical protein
MTSLMSISSAPQADGFATAPQGNVMQASHKHVTRLNPPSPNATSTFDFGEAD